MPRRLKLNERVQNIICEALANGVTVETAAEIAGIGQSTLYNWLKLGREGVAKYKPFADAVEEAIAKSELVLLERIHEASKHTWQAAAWILERRFPERWGRRDRLNVTETSLIARLDEHARNVLLQDPEIQRLSDMVIERIAELDAGNV